MKHLMTTKPVVVGPRTTVDPNPADRYSAYTVAWLLIIGAFAVVEAIALKAEANAEPGDRVKRTLSSHLRSWGATDSVTGIPLNVRYGKLRRIALGGSQWWLGKHLNREQDV